MMGMMAGGLVWGLMGDYLGRLSVLFGSILLYSLGNILNAFVTTPEAYQWCRFITGFGLAGELGAAITLVAEILPQNSRGLGTTVIATLGLAGAVAAAFLGIMAVRWDYAYLLSGIMGIILLFTRFQVFESGMFTQAKKENAMSLGSAPWRQFLQPLEMLIFSRRIFRYLACIAVGAPIYFITGTLFTFAPELTSELGIEGVAAAPALLWGTIGLTVGDFLSGIISQLMRSRKRTLYLSLILALGASLFYLLAPDLTPGHIYTLTAIIGLFAGYWAVLITTIAEQFGTNLRATATTTIPNFIRGTGALLLQLFVWWRSIFSGQQAALMITCLVFSLALIATYFLKESFQENLDYQEGPQSF